MTREKFSIETFSELRFSLESFTDDLPRHDALEETTSIFPENNSTKKSMRNLTISSIHIRWDHREVPIPAFIALLRYRFGRVAYNLPFVMTTTNTRKEFAMQVYANDQIGYAPLTNARAYGARARTSNQSMNIPFNVSEGFSTGGKINRQYLPSQTLKVDETEQGRPSGGEGNTMADSNINRWPSSDGDVNTMIDPNINISPSGGGGTTMADSNINRWPSSDGDVNTMIDPNINISPSGGDGNTMADPYIQTLPNTPPTESQLSGANKDYGLLTGYDAVSKGLGQAYGFVLNYTPSASPSFIHSQAKALSSKNYMSTTTDVRLKLADHYVVC
jgi:hypothetical protein